MKMKLELLCKVKNYIKYKTPWRHVTYNRRLYYIKEITCILILVGDENDIAL